MKMNRVRILLLLVLPVWVVSAYAVDATLSLDQNVIRTWGVDQGLPQGTVYALTQTADGYVWAATQEGFVRFDGAEFITYDKAASPQIHNNMTHALLAARDGSLWIGTRGSGLLRYRSGQVRAYTAADGLPSANVGAIYEDSHGTLWIGTLDHGVGRFRDEHFDFAGDALGIGNKAVSSFREDREGNLWIGSTNGLTRIAEGRVIPFAAAQGLLADKVRTVSADPNGALWIGTGRGVQTLDGRHFGKGSGLSSDLVMSTLAGRDGSLW